LGIILPFYGNNNVIFQAGGVFMPNIKQKHGRFVDSRAGEAITVSASGALVFTLIAASLGAVAEFVSNTVYPFSYPFLHTPLHGFIPRIALRPPLPATLIFAALFTLGIYYFEKNIFYRRFHLALKACFAAIAACALVFVSNLLSAFCYILRIEYLSFIFYSTNVAELPFFLVYYYLTSLPLFLLSGMIRRNIYALP
jgi:hypothetical protein